MDKPKVIVVTPACAAANTRRLTCEAIPKNDVDQIILVDDGSGGDTLAAAESWIALS